MPEQILENVHSFSLLVESRMGNEEHVSRKRPRQKESVLGSDGDNRNKLLKGQYKKGLWAKEEDTKLLELVKEQQECPPSGSLKIRKLNWTIVSKGMKTRSCKQCRERWVNHLNPGVRKTKWTSQEDVLLLSLAAKNPRKWAQISRQMPGRTENMVKIRWNSLNKQSASPRTSKNAKLSTKPLSISNPLENKSNESGQQKSDLKHESIPFIKNTIVDYCGHSPEYMKSEPFIEEVVLDDFVLDAFFIENSNPSFITSGWDHLVPINL